MTTSQTTSNIAHTANPAGHTQNLWEQDNKNSVFGELRSAFADGDMGRATRFYLSNPSLEVAQYVASKLRVTFLPAVGPRYYHYLMEAFPPMWKGGKSFPHRPDSNRSIAVYLACLSKWEATHVAYLGEHFNCTETLAWARDAHKGLLELVAQESLGMTEFHVNKFLAYWILNTDYSDHICRGIWYRTHDHRELQASPDRGDWRIEIRPVKPYAKSRELEGKIRHDVVMSSPLSWTISSLSLNSWG